MKKVRRKHGIKYRIIRMNMLMITIVLLLFSAGAWLVMGSLVDDFHVSGEILTLFALTLCGLTLLSMAICFVVSVLISNSFSRPILELKEAVKSPITREDNIICSDLEIKELEQAFYDMRRTNEENIRRLGEEKEKQNLFFNSATHQLKTPLTSIIGYSEIIKRLSSDEDVCTSAGYIENAGKDLLELVEDIISIARFQRTEYEFVKSWFRLDILCDECLKLLFPRLQRCGISAISRCEVVEIFFDRDRVKEVLLNLLDNCIIHSGCTQITITSSSMPLRLRVFDNGKGLSQDHLRRMFEPFYRPTKTTTRGSGLGLSICKAIMTTQNGDVEIESKEGEGTCVNIYFHDKSDKSQPHFMARRI